MITVIWGIKEIVDITSTSKLEVVGEGDIRYTIGEPVELLVAYQYNDIRVLEKVTALVVVLVVLALLAAVVLSAAV